MNDNDKKIREYQKQKAMKWIMLTCSFLVIILEVLALLNVIDMLWGLALFALMYIIKKFFLK